MQTARLPGTGAHRRGGARAAGAGSSLPHVTSNAAAELLGSLLRRQMHVAASSVGSSSAGLVPSARNMVTSFVRRSAMARAAPGALGTEAALEPVGIHQPRRAQSRLLSSVLPLTLCAFKMWKHVHS